MKKVITMLLTFAIAISGIAVPTNKANAETAGLTTFEFDGVIGATATPVPTVTPVPTAQPEDEDEDEDEEEVKKAIAVALRCDSNYFPNGYLCEDGETMSITKGFTDTMKLSPSDKKAVKWTTDNPDVITVKTKPIDKKKGQYCTVKAKKYGKAKLTAEYNGKTTTITVKVVKNEYSCKVKDLPTWKSYDIKANMKYLGWNYSGVTSAKFDKKGNLVLKCYKEYHPSKYGKVAEYHSVKSFNNSSSIDIHNDKGKMIFTYKVKTGKGKNHTGRTLSVQHPKKKETIVIPKSRIKNKNLDLRKVDYDYITHYNCSCGEALKAHK